MEEFPRNQQIELRSPEVQEIIGQMPGRIIRWGIVVIFLVICALLFISWFIRYPDILVAKVVITTTPPPVTLVSRTSGTLVLLKNENVNLSRGEMIGYLRSNASPEAVLLLEQKILQGGDLPGLSLPGSLGDLQVYYANLIKAQTELAAFNRNKLFDVQIFQLKTQVSTYQKLGKSLAGQYNLALQELALAKEKFKTDSLLFVQKVNSALDFNQSKTIWLQQLRSARNSEMTLINNEVQSNQLHKQISDLEIQKGEQRQKLELNVTHTRQELLAQISKWKENYLFTASADGQLAFLGFLENDQFVEPGKPLFSIIPTEGQLIARAELPLRGSGKVKEGQQVSIRLENYPFEQFGMIRGKVSTISALPGEDKYWVTIELPKQLITSQKKTLSFKQQLTGSTEIITEDLRLLERFVYQFRKLFQAAEMAQS